MSPETLNTRFRYFLFFLAGAIFVGTVVELLFSNHMETAVQYIPFFLCAIGFVTLIVAVARPQRSTLLALRAVMVVVIGGSLFGIFEHIESNIEFALEIRPNAVLGDVFWQALGGANPLLAPGILALGGLIALAATYYHPKLSDPITEA